MCIRDSNERIEPHTQGTGYWYITDPQHPQYAQYIEQLQGSSATAPTLSVTTNVPPLSSDPTLSPFVTARVSSDPDSDSSSTPREEQGSDDPSPEQLYPEDPVLTAQLQYGLDIQDREPENPLTPDQPAYQQLIEEAIEAGLNIPLPPPIAQVLLALAPQLPAPQPIVPIQNIMAAPAPQTGRLRGEAPDVFTGDRAKTRKFKPVSYTHLTL